MTCLRLGIVALVLALFAGRSMAQTATSTSQPSSSANPSVFGQNVTFVVTVTTSTAGQRVDSGTVTFKDNGTALGAAVPVRFGLAAFSISTLAVGTHPITADYSGVANVYAASSSPAALDQVVDKDTTNTTVTSSVNPAAVNQTINYTAKVTAATPGSGTPTGSVTFTDNGVPLGAAVSLTNGQATVMTSYATAGTHTIVATYGGDGDFDGSISPAFNETVNAPGTTTVVVSSSANPSVFGESVTLTASVSGASSGTVTFFDGATTLGSGSVNAGGQATYTTSALTVATHNITAQYNNTTSSVFQQVVDKATTQLALTSNINPSPVNQAVTYTATLSVVAPGGGTPTGTVTFLDNGTAITAPVTVTNSQAAATVTYNAAGNHNIVATYSGDLDFTKSNQQLLQVVSATALKPTTTALVSSANPSSAGASVTFTATVSAAAGGTPTGMVLFNDGATTIGSGMLDGNGKATLATTMLAVGTHAIQAVYGGDASYSGSTSSALQQVVDAAGVVDGGASVDAADTGDGGAAGGNDGSTQMSNDAGAGSDDGGAPMSGNGNGGCGCSLTGGSAWPLSPLALLLVGFLAFRSRRRRA